MTFYFHLSICFQEYFYFNKKMPKNFYLRCKLDILYNTGKNLHNKNQ